jgi:hypothetical protein
MPNTCFDPTDLIIPAFDACAKTRELTVQFHPGQVRMLQYLADCGRFPFHQVADAVRCCVCLGIEALFSPFPSPFAIVEARMNILNDEKFERQKDVLGDSVQKYLSFGDVENARRVVKLSFQEYSRIQHPYWKPLWLSTLEPAIEMLCNRGVNLRLDELAHPNYGRKYF